MVIWMSDESKEMHFWNIIRDYASDIGELARKTKNKSEIEISEYDKLFASLEALQETTTALKEHLKTQQYS